jgi:hypothetical protein
VVGPAARARLPEEADDLLRRRFAIIQVWRPVRYPVETFPLSRIVANHERGVPRACILFMWPLARINYLAS